MAKFFTSDTHFEHAGLIEKMGRPWFSSVEVHDGELLENINSKVGRNDQLYIIGDFALKNPQKYSQRIVCKHKKLVIGNHDRKEQSKKAFGEWRDIITVKPFGDKCAILLHYPMAFWPKSHHGSYHLYGHCHQQREATLDGLFPTRRSMDVGVDNARILLGKCEPFSEQEILDILSGRPGCDSKEFYDSLRSSGAGGPGR